MARATSPHQPDVFLCLLAILSQLAPSFFLHLCSGASLAHQVSPAELHALLDFKARIIASADELLPGWNASNAHNLCTSWAGVTCTPSGLHVAGIHLPGLRLAGSLSPHLGNLTFLSTLNLSFNHLTQGIPPQLSACSSLQILDLHNNFLSGGIPSQLSECSSLQVLNLNFNNLTGPIPPSLGSLSSLEVLRLRANDLKGRIPLPLFTNCTSLTTLSLCRNSLIGSIPSTWHLPKLQFLALWDNHLTGPIPPSIGNCSKLEYLSVFQNYLSGAIPWELGNVSNLATMDLSYNSLSGAMPTQLGLFLPMLAFFNLQYNMLTGQIPSSLARCTNLWWIGLSFNELTGEIPTELGSLNKLQGLLLNVNHIVGGIPSSLGNCTSLATIWLAQNQLSGPIPATLGNLAQLQAAYFWGNSHSGTIPPSLGNCTMLSILETGENQLKGFIPKQILKLEHLQKLLLNDNQLRGFEQPLSFGNATSLFELRLNGNRMGGPIPPELGKLQGLQSLDLSFNPLSGEVPWGSLSNCTSLWLLDLSNNHLTGTLSQEIQRLSRLRELHLQHNGLQGPIPNLGNVSLQGPLDLSFNQLNGTLPNSLVNALRHAQSLDLSHNGLFGSLPTWLGADLLMIQDIQLSNNHFTGTIPGTLGDCDMLRYLNLSSNDLAGEIPPQLGNILYLTTMDLSNNHLTGTLPSALQHLQHLRIVNVSFNRLHGPIPVAGVFKHLDASSFAGNPGLCGLVIHKPCTNVQPTLHRSHLGWIKSILIVLPSIVVTTALLVTTFWCKARWSRWKLSERDGDHLVKGLGKTRKFTAVEISKSTQNYSEMNRLGEGALGVVYKGVLPNGELIAIKKFKDIAYSRETLLKEVDIMSNLRHRNLVKVLGYVLNLEVCALVLQFIPNGSLEEHLRHCKIQIPNGLSLAMILKIAQGLVNALAYLHHEFGVASIIHGDVKPSNILLDNEFEAHLADFGLAKLAKGSTALISISSNIKGSIGYMAPELAYLTKYTNKVDVYSFGVVVLEMVTGIGPSDELLDGLTLHEWVKHKLLHDAMSVKEFVHPSLLQGTSSTTETDESKVHLLLQMAIRCTNIVPNKRPTMQEIKAFLVTISKNIPIV